MSFISLSKSYVRYVGSTEGALMLSALCTPILFPLYLTWSCFCSIWPDVVSAMCSPIRFLLCVLRYFLCYVYFDVFCYMYFDVVSAICPGCPLQVQATGLWTLQNWVRRYIMLLRHASLELVTWRLFWSLKEFKLNFLMDLLKLWCILTDKKQILRMLGSITGMYPDAGLFHSNGLESLGQSSSSSQDNVNGLES